MQILAFFDTNMLVSPTRNCGETISVGPSRWFRPPMRAFGVGDTNMLVSKNRHRLNAKPYRPNTTPNSNQWNIGGVGSSGIGADVGHVHFMLFVSISFALGSQCKCGF